MSERLATLGIVVDPSGAVIGTATVDKSLLKTGATSTAVTRKMKTQWSSVRGTFLKVAAAASAMLGGITVAGAVAEFAKFEQGMKNVKAVSGSTAAELKLLSEAALDAAASTRFNPEETTQALYSLASAGLAANEQMAALPNVLNLAEAGQAALGQTTELVVSTLAQFGFAAEQSQRVVDVFTASIGSSSVNVARLQVGMSAVGPTANALNQSFESTTAALNVLTTSFGSGELAGTGLKTVLGSLAVEGHKMGLDVRDAAGNMLPLTAILDQITEKGVSVEEQFKVLGLRGGPALAALLNVGTDALRDMEESIRSNGQAAAVAADQLDTLQGDADQMASAFDVFQVKLGETFSENMRSLVQGITEAIKSITEAIPDAVLELKIFRENWKLLFSDVQVQGADTKQMVEDLHNFISFMWEGLRDLPLNLIAFFKLTTEALGIMWDAIRYGAETAVQLALQDWTRFKFGFEAIILSLKGAWGLFMDFLKNTAALAINKIALSLKKIKIGPFKSWATDLDNAAKALRANATGVVDIKTQVKALNVELEKELEFLEGFGESNKERYEAEKLRHVEKMSEILAEKDAILASYDSQKGAVAEVIAEVDKIVIANNGVGEAAKVWQDAGTEGLQSWLDRLEKMEDVMRREWAGVMRALDFGDITPLLAKAIREGFANGAASGMQVLRNAQQQNPQGFTESVANGVGATANFLNFAAGQFGQSGTGGTELGAANSVAGAAGAALAAAQIIPVVGQVIAAVAAVLALVDSISGGKLFGTAYETVSSGLNLAVGASGTTGEEFTNQSRQRSLFRGTARRTKTGILDPEIEAAMNDLLNSITGAMVDAARILAVDIPNIIEGEFSTEYDKDGNLTKSMSTVMGRIYNESIEEFSKRLTAENLLSVLMLGAADVLTEVNGRGLGGNFGGLGVGGDDNRFTGNDNNFGGGVGGPENAGFEGGELGGGFAGGSLGPGAGVGESSMELINIVELLARRWRDDADLLLQGAEFLFIAMSDAKEGFDLLQDGDLIALADLVEELNVGAETLSDTYIKLKVSTNVLDDALNLMGIGLDLNREEFIRFAADITDAAGSVGTALGLWRDFFTAYFTANELGALSLSKVKDEVLRISEDLGLAAGSIDFTNFREQFEEAMPNLSAAEIVQWLQLGDALARANDLGLQMGEIMLPQLIEALEIYGEGVDGMFIGTETLAQSMARASSELDELIGAYDGSAQAQIDLTGAIANKYQMELQFLNQIESVMASIQGVISKAIEDITLSQLNPEEQYDFLKAKADELAASLGQLQDPDDIARVVAEIDDLQRQAFNLLDDTQKEKMAQGFIDFLTGVEEVAKARLDELRDQVEQDQQDTSDKLALLLDDYASRTESSTQALVSAADTMTNASLNFVQGVDKFVNTPIVVTVNGGFSSGFESN